MYLIQLHVPDLNLNNNQFSSTQQQEQFFRNVPNEKYHTNVVTEMKKTIIASEFFVKQFRNFVLNTILNNSIRQIVLQNKNQYNILVRKTI